MSVDVDICNSALIKLGQERINSLDDDNKRARLCKEQYQKIIERTLRGHPWGFALKRTVISPETATLAFGDSNIFQIPLDCLRIVKLDTNYTYKVEGDKIISPIDEARLLYVSSSTPEAYYDSNFVEAAACWLAHDLCYALTQSTNLKQVLFAEAEQWIAQARSFNSQEQSPDNLEFDSWTNARLL